MLRRQSLTLPSKRKGFTISHLQCCPKSTSLFLKTLLFTNRPPVNSSFDRTRIRLCLIVTNFGFVCVFFDSTETCRLSSKNRLSSTLKRSSQRDQPCAHIRTSSPGVTKIYEQNTSHTLFGLRNRPPFYPVYRLVYDNHLSILTQL
jgi:hypothetical protein